MTANKWAAVTMTRLSCFRRSLATSLKSWTRSREPWIISQRFHFCARRWTLLSSARRTLQVSACAQFPTEDRLPTSSALWNAWPKKNLAGITMSSQSQSTTVRCTPQWELNLSRSDQHASLSIEDHKCISYGLRAGTQIFQLYTTSSLPRQCYNKRVCKLRNKCLSVYPSLCDLFYSFRSSKLT